MKRIGRGLAGGIGAAACLFFLSTVPCQAAPQEPVLPPELPKEYGLPEEYELPEDFGLPGDLELPEDWPLDLDSEESLTLSLTPAELEPMWDLNYRGFCYTLPNDTWFTMNVPAGAVSTGAVTMELSDNLYVMHIERDGELLDFSMNLHFSEPGNYQIILNTARLESEKTPIIYQLPLQFTICGKAVNSLNTLEVPEGFFLRSASVNGQDRTVSDSLLVLSEDGDWRFTFVSSSDTRAVYDLGFRLDRHAPELSFSKPIDQGAVTPPLMITSTEEDCEILVQRGSEVVPLTTGVLKSGGFYRVIARDSQGNERSYRVQIRYTVFRLTPGLLLVLAAGAAGLAGYLWYLRRHTRV